MHPRLSVEIGGVFLKNPVTVASGTYGYGNDFKGFYHPSKLGGLFIKGITTHSRMGNPTPRIVETPSGMINAIGLQNIGIDALEQQASRQFKEIGTEVFANISGADEEDFAQLAYRASRVPGISALELNVSCPNLKSGGIDFGRKPDLTKRITQVCVQNSAKPVFVKLTPNVTDIVRVAEAAMFSGAAGVTLVNTFQAMSIDIERRKPYLANIMGGLSGPAIRPIAVRMVWQIWKALKCPIIGMGGITSHEDALEFIMAGAAAVSIGTMNFVNPTVAVDVIDGLETWCRNHGVGDISQLIGVAQK